MHYCVALRGAQEEGHRITREGWNASGQWVVYRKGYPEGIPVDTDTARALRVEEGTVCRFLPYMLLRTADGAFVPWTPTQSDQAAMDWRIVGDKD